MATPDHAAYVHDVARAIRHSENSWSWTKTPHIDHEQLEISDAAIAIEAYLYTGEPGPGGIISLPDGQAAAWHQQTGWQVLDSYGDSTPLDLPVDASPRQVARVVAQV